MARDKVNELVVLLAITAAVFVLYVFFLGEIP